jgi:hypothetical protein
MRLWVAVIKRHSERTAVLPFNRRIDRFQRKTFRSTVEGTFVKGLDRRERRRVLRFALERLMSG